MQQARRRFARGRSRGGGASLSVQAMAWAIRQQVVTAPGSRHVLLCLCNYADADGDAIFPSVKRLARDTGLSRRAVQYQLRKIVGAGALSPSDPVLVAAKIKRADRRPLCYRVNFAVRNDCTPYVERGAMVAPTGCNLTHPRGAMVAPDPSSDPSLNRQSTEGAKSAGAEQEAREELKRNLRTLARVPFPTRRGH